MARPLLLRLHRYVGLAIAAFLVTAGLTGSVIAFKQELDEWLNPDLFFTGTAGQFLPPQTLVNGIEARDARVRVNFLSLPRESGRAVEALVEPRLEPISQQAYRLSYDTVFVDPISGRLLGQRHRDACCFERQNVMNFLHHFHYSLRLPGIWGMLLMGLVALLWAIDCFVGLYLTLPRGTPFWGKWKTAWLIKHGASSVRLNFDWHRASGLWVWGLLLLMATSGVALNLPDQIFKPVVSLFSPLTPGVFDRAHDGRKDSNQPVISFDAMLARGEAEASRRGWQGWSPTSIRHIADSGFFGVGFDGHAQPTNAPRLGMRWLYFDDRNQRLLDTYIPGKGTAGDQLLQLQFPLHSGQIAGMTGRIIIAVMGWVVILLSITGIILWWQKREGRSGRMRQAVLSDAQVYAPPTGTED